MPTIVGELGGLTHLSWVVTAYLLASTVVGPLYGKFGDLYGRKLVLQVAIVIFLIGSVLCGLAQNMGQLIVFRALQGIGGGGLIVTTIAVIGDLIPPRERGRYQGLFGAVFGFATIVGPLLGGFFVDHLTWRWIFYVNLPVGAVALAVIAAVMRSPTTRRPHVIDYPGALLLSVALTAIILFTSLGGTTFPWGSPFILGLIAVGIVCTLAFIAVERRAPEPLLPLDLFRNHTFAITSSVGLIVGLSLFGSVTYLPIYLQVVKGESPTASGLQLMPMMLGMLVTSVISGRLITRWGRYKPFPVIGTAIMTFGLLLLSRISADLSVWRTSMNALLLGLRHGHGDAGAGDRGPEQRRLRASRRRHLRHDAVPLGRRRARRGAVRRHFRQWAARPSGRRLAARRHYSRPMPLRSLRCRQNIRAHYISAVVAALRPVFLVAAGVAALGFALTLMLREIPLRGMAPAEGLGESFAMPRDATSLAELERIVRVLMARENRWRVYSDLAARCRLDLPAPELWLLARLGEREPMTAHSLSAELGIALDTTRSTAERALRP